MYEREPVMFRSGETRRRLSRTWGMVPRSRLIAVLIGVEIVLVLAMIDALRGGSLHVFTGGPLADLMPAAPHFGGNAAGTEAARGQRRFTFATSANPDVTVDAGDTDVTIVAQPENRVDDAVHHEVAGIAGGSTSPVIARADGDRIHISGGHGLRWLVFGYEHSSVQIGVPAGARVTVAHAGSITASGLRNAASFTADNGTIRVSDFQGALTASSSNGRIEVASATSPTLHVESSNGRIVLRDVIATHVDLSSSNGRIDGTGLRFHDGSVSGQNGRVALSFVHGTDATIVAESSNGHVNVAGASVQGGIASNDRDDDDKDSSTTVRIGAGTGRLDVHSSNGSIDLTQEG